VTAALVEQAPAKINLTLRVIGRRADGYHELESLVVFAACGDTLTLRPDALIGLSITGPYADACGPIANNLVLKAVAALRARVPGLKAGYFQLDKNLPVAAGIGGGSSDAAAALRLAARLNGIALDDPRLAASALVVGADVPVCLDPRARIMRGVGEQLSAPIDMPRLAAVLINPGVALATRDVFSKLSLAQLGSAPLAAVPENADAIFDYLAAHGNDLTDAAIACAPAVSEVLNALAALPGVRLARMSGSGSTCFALFSSAADATAAASRLQKARPAWWVAATSLG
jgi:4-diphosphocytidyl-2-C-methyl-D-erythritol kinase